MGLDAGARVRTIMRMNVTAEDVDLEVCVPMLGRRQPTWVTVAARDLAAPTADELAALVAAKLEACRLVTMLRWASGGRRGSTAPSAGDWPASIPYMVEIVGDEVIIVGEYRRAPVADSLAPGRRRRRVRVIDPLHAHRLTLHAGALEDRALERYAIAMEAIANGPTTIREAPVEVIEVGRWYAVTWLIDRQGPHPFAVWIQVRGAGIEGARNAARLILGTSRNVTARAAEPRLDYAAILNPGETAIAYQLEG